MLMNNKNLQIRNFARLFLFIVLVINSCKIHQIVKRNAPKILQPISAD